MNKALELKPQRVTYDLLLELERKGLIKTLKAPKNVWNTEASADDGIEVLYKSAPQYGGHKLICVQKNNTQIGLVTHPDIEEFILLDPTDTNFKPLYLVIGLLPQREFEEKASREHLTSEDVIVLEMDFNNPKTCYFSMMPFTPHCEVTASGDGMGPVFFVTEPSELVQVDIAVSGYTFKVVS